MVTGRTAWFFWFFLLSGFCSLICEVVWLRLAMAAFGVTTPFVSIVLSVFMGGLALGSYAAGKLTHRFGSNPAFAALRAYAIAEFLIGLSAFAVPAGLDWGRSFLAGGGGGVAWASSSYYLTSGAWITVVMLPFTTAMGATFPFAMAALRPTDGREPTRSFSGLYVANVLGAATGTLVSALILIELFGLRGTLRVGAALNLGLAIAAFVLGQRARELASDRPGGGDTPISVSPRAMQTPQPVGSLVPGAASAGAPRTIPVLLFTTGLVSMAMEIVWVRQYTPYLGTVVYAFATILATYLLATFAGSAAYRRWARAGASGGGVQDGSLPSHAWALAGFLALLPLLLVDPTFALPGDFPQGVLRAVVGLAPFCAAVGFLTPMLVDRWSGGDPEKAGGAYAVNITGCIAGPLISGFILLPALGERGSLVVLAIPLFAVGLTAAARGRRMRVAWAVTAAAAGVVLVTHDYAARYPGSETRRDYSATVIAAGEGMKRDLYVNGISMTKLGPITKMMVHLPAVFLDHPPKKILVVCFGMGTTFRSGLSWGVPTTAVDLIPSVPELFGYYHEDAPDRLRDPGAEIVIDDGRRLLARAPDLYDVITVDPPPPEEAAGSSLLYSKEFHAMARARLAPGGIFSIWLPEAEPTIVTAVAKAVSESYSNVMVFQSMKGWGFHFLASADPLVVPSPKILIDRLPARAAADLVEWGGPLPTPEDYFRQVITHMISIRGLLDRVPGVPPVTDDRPVNEYFFLRRLRAGTLNSQGK